MGEWPVAYPGVPLQRHLCCVAEALRVYMARRLVARVPAVAWFEGHTWRGSVLDAGLLAAALHDVGKASRYYEGKRSFYLHEAVSAVFAVGLYRWLVGAGSRAAPVALLAAMAVARHHAAMRGRLPRELAGNTKSLTIIAEALGAFEAGDMVSAGIHDLLGETVLAVLVGEYVDLARQAPVARARVVGERLRQLAAPRELASAMGGEVSGEYAGALVSMVTGALIVADVLVAGVEGREDEGRRSGVRGDEAGDESGAPAYARHWAEELGAGDLRERLTCWRGCGRVGAMFAALRERMGGYRLQ